MEEKINRRARQIILFAFVFAFFAVSPIIILYTAGYRYNWQLRRIEQTGVLSIDATPRDAAVYLSGTRIEKTMPIRLANRTPGTYELLIEKNGYKPWRKDITIESKRSTYIKNISLFKEAPPALLLSEKDRRIVAMDPSADGLFLALTTFGDDFFDIEIMNTQSERRILLGRYLTAEPPRVLWSPYGSFGALHIRDEDGHKFQLFDPASGALYHLYTFPDRQEGDAFLWMRSAIAPTLSVQEGGTLRNITADTITQITTIPPYAVWYVADDGTLWLNDPAAHVIFPANRPAASLSYPNAATLESIADINSRRIILKTSQGIIVRTLAPLSEQTIPTHALLYRATTREWIAWSPWELWSLYEDGSAALLNRTSEETSSLFPMDNYGVLLLSTPTSLIAFNPGYYVSHDLFRGGAIERIAVEKESRKIYFLGSVANKRGLYTLEF